MPLSDSVEPCAFCREVGCVRVERVIQASVAERTFHCGRCGKQWVVAKIFEHACPDCEECVRLDIVGVVFWDEYRSALDQLVQSDEADPNYPERLSAMKAAERQVIAQGKEWKAHQLTHRPVKSNAECASSGRNLRSRRAALD